MAKKGLRAGKSFKGQYTAYKNNDSWFKNTRRRFLRNIKNQPNNKQLEIALKRLDELKKTYNRNNNNSEHTCKGYSREFGFKDNKPTEHHVTSPHRYVSAVFNFRKQPSAQKAENVNPIKEQLLALGFKEKKRKKKYYGRKHKKAT